LWYYKEVKKRGSPVNGIVLEGRGQGGDRREVLLCSLDASDLHGVGVDGTRDGGSVTVLDLEGAGLLGRSGGGAGLEAILGLTGAAGTGGWWDPEIGGAS
jgi:hypothetical protein